MSRSLAELDIKIDGHAFHRELRANQPLYRDPLYGMYVVSRYDDVQSVLRQANLFSASLAIMSSFKYEDVVTRVLVEEGCGPLERVLPMTDPPEHTRLRGMVNLAFSARRVAKVLDYIEKLTGELIDRFIDEGRFEVVSQLATPLPVTVIGDMLSLPRERWRDIIRWTLAYSTCAGNRITSEEHAMQIGRDLAEMQNFITGHLDKVRVNPGDDVLTDLLNAKFEDYEPLNQGEILATAVAFMGAGHETSTVAITNAVKRLAESSELRAQIRNAPDQEAAVRQFCEEVLRLDPPLNAQPRIATADTELLGTKIPAGTPILCLNASANRDERVFGEDSETLRLDRPNSNRHVTFGYGVHSCLGNMLARAELRSVTRAIVNRMDDMALVNPQIPQSDYEAVIMDWNYCLKKLEVSFKKRA